MASPSFHPRDPLHGIKLETIVTFLVDRYGWAEMAYRIPVRCFQINPSIKSTLTFLRQTPWARQKVEGWFIDENSWKAEETAESPAEPAPSSVPPTAASESPTATPPVTPGSNG